MLEPREGKPSRVVLRGARAGNSPTLPDDGRLSIEDVIIEKIKGYFRGQETNLWFNIEQELKTAQHRILNPPSQVDIDRTRAFVKRLGLKFKVC